MNIHNKLRQLGFRKIKPHYLDNNYSTGNRFVPYEESTKSNRIQPKWSFTYLYKFSEEIKVWAQIEKHSDIMMYVESPDLSTTHTLKYDKLLGRKQGKDIGLIYSNKQGYDKKYPALTSINDLIRYLPLPVQRDIQLARLLG